MSFSPMYIQHKYRDPEKLNDFVYFRDNQWNLGWGLVTSSLVSVCHMGYLPHLVLLVSKNMKRFAEETLHV